MSQNSKISTIPTPKDETMLSGKGRAFHPGKKLEDTLIFEIAWLLGKDEKMTNVEIAQKLRIHENTVSKYKMKLFNGEDIYQQNFKPKESGIHTQPENVDYIYHLIITYPITTIRKIQKAYEAAFDIEISMSHIYYIVTEILGFKKKKTQMVEWPRQNPAIRSLFLQYLEQMIPILSEYMEDLIFIDESHFRSAVFFREHGYFLPGTNPLAYKQGIYKDESCSLILAIGSEGRAHHTVKNHFNSCGVNSSDFIQFLLELHYDQPIQRIFIMDNAKLHKSEMVRFIIQGMQDDGRRVVYQSKYSPDLNPIELVFGILKRRAKDGVQVPKQLIPGVEKLCYEIDEKMCYNTIKRIFHVKDVDNDDENENENEE